MHDQARPSTRSENRPLWGRLWILCGCLLVPLTAATVLIEQQPGADTPAATWGIPTGPWRLIGGGALCLLAAWCGPRDRMTGGSLAFLLIVAVGMRGPLWAQPARPQADYQRYLWDGAMVANGVNPYRASPHEAHIGSVADPTVARLADEGRRTLTQINWMKLRTIYPPVAQGLFGLAHWISPFSLNAWRVVLAGADILAAAAVLSLLRRNGMPTMYAAIYLWNPLLAWETYMGCHVDLAAAAVAICGVWLLSRQKFALAAVVIVIAAGIKLWPLILLAFVLGPLWGQWRSLAVTVAVAAAAAAVLAILYLPALGPHSGLEAYTRTWRANPGLFWLLRTGLPHAFGGDPDVRVRIAMAAALAASVVLLARGATTELPAMAVRMAIAAQLMLLLSPTLYPWYYIAVLPLAATGPSPAVLVWTVLGPLCYWRVDPANEPLRWAATHIPVWIALAVSAALAVRQRRAEAMALTVEE